MHWTKGAWVLGQGTKGTKSPEEADFRPPSPERGVRVHATHILHTNVETPMPCALGWGLHHPRPTNADHSRSESRAPAWRGAGLVVRGAAVELQRAEGHVVVHQHPVPGQVRRCATTVVGLPLNGASAVCVRGGSKISPFKVSRASAFGVQGGRRRPQAGGRSPGGGVKRSLGGSHRESNT